MSLDSEISEFLGMDIAEHPEGGTELVIYPHNFENPTTNIHIKEQEPKDVENLLRKELEGSDLR